MGGRGQASYWGVFTLGALIPYIVRDWRQGGEARAHARRATFLLAAAWLLGVTHLLLHAVIVVVIRWQALLADEGVETPAWAQLLAVGLRHGNLGVIAVEIALVFLLALDGMLLARRDLPPRRLPAWLTAGSRTA